MALVDVVIPTLDRPEPLAVTLTSLVGQRYNDFRVLISDQTETGDTFAHPLVEVSLNVLRVRGHAIEVFHHLPNRGMAEQRQFLLDQTAAAYTLFVDDDLILEPYVIGNMLQAIQEEQCGFVGSAVIGLSYLDDMRPDEQAIQFWDRPVEKERVLPGSPQWQRYRLHNAANLYHVAQQLGLSPAAPRKYRVAWVGGCVMYDTAKLRATGGFDFWKEYPQYVSGEDVLAQLRVMARYGGCGLIPSGVYHQELPTTVPDRSFNAPEVYFADHPMEEFPLVFAGKES